MLQKRWPKNCIGKPVHQLTYTYSHHHHTNQPGGKSESGLFTNTCVYNINTQKCTHIYIHMYTYNCLILQANCNQFFVTCNVNKINPILWSQVFFFNFIEDIIFLRKNCKHWWVYAITDSWGTKGSNSVLYVYRFQPLFSMNVGLWLMIQQYCQIYLVSFPVILTF